MTEHYTYEEALASSLEYFGNDELAAKVFVDKYALRDNDDFIVEKNPNDMFSRIAGELARIEEKKFKKPFTKEEIISYMEGFKRIVPQGSPMNGIGNPYQYTTLSNCFVAGTRVITDKGVKNIEEVKIGDRVITHLGRFKDVSQVHKNGLGVRQLFDIKCYRSPCITVTENHKFLSITKEQMEWGESLQWNDVSHLRTGDYIAIPRHDEIIGITTLDIANIFPLSFVRHWDKMKHPHKYETDVQKNTIEVKTIWQQGSGECTKKHHKINRYWKCDRDFAYFMGLWYGDGCVFSYSRKGSGLRNRQSVKNSSKILGITFTFGAHEKNLISFVSDYGRKLFGIEPDVNDNSSIDGSVQIVFHSFAIGYIFDDLFGRGCRGKTLNNDIFKWDREQVISLLQGLVDSDGTITSDGQCRVVLSNRDLIEQFYHLARVNGISVGIVNTMASGYARIDFTQNDDFVVNSNKIYKDDRVGKASNSPTSKIGTIENCGYKMVRIDKKIKNLSHPEFVYTLGVDDDHSYPVEGLVSLNCFVVDSPADSYGAILRADQQMVQICKRRGGVGLDISNLRPNKTPTSNAAKTSTGIIPFAERFSNSIREVAQNGRRGALMVSLSVHHPEILEFASAKRDLKRLTGANISVRLSDEFLKAVEKDEDYELRWPVDSESPKISIKKNARQVWRSIIKNAHAMAEPGLLFWDTILRESPADCYAKLGFRTLSTNPCGELPLCAFDSCRLLLLNLFAYVVNPFTDKAYFDYAKFIEDAKVAQRFMDDIIDLELESIAKILHKIKNDPEDSDVKKVELDLWAKIKKTCESGRRTGTGITALGDTLAALGIKYGSEDSIKTVGEIYKTLKLACYRSSVEMAKELGAFPVWDRELEKDCPFLLRIKDEDPQLYKDMSKFGRRNISLLTSAPAGSVSILTMTTSGIEPLFEMSYTKKKKINPNDKNARIDMKDDNGDCWQTFKVYHPKVKQWMEISGCDDVKKSPWYGCTAADLNWESRVKLQAAATANICHSISSTVNLPNSATVEDVAKIYETAWRSGCKGITVYRDGCRDGVLIKDTVAKEKKNLIAKNDAPKRPKTLPADIHHIKVLGKEYFVLVGMYEGDPYEVFAGPNGMIDNEVKHGKIIREKRGSYRAEFDNGQAMESIIDCEDEYEEAMTRMISCSLRHGADISFIVHQLEKTKGLYVGFAKSVAKALKKYIKDGTKVTGEVCKKCGSDKHMQRREGCVFCMSCGESKCS